MPLPSSLSGREAVLKAADNHPFARLRAHGNTISGYQAKHALVWKTEQGGRHRLCGLGAPAQVADLCIRLSENGDIAPGALLEVPRVDVSTFRGFAVEKHEYWSILWTKQPHPHLEHDDRVVHLPASESAAIDSLLDVAFPATRNRPGNDDIHRWFGIYEEGQLIAVGADRSQNGVGYLVAIAVMPNRQGQGHGAALTRRIARELLTETDICALGVTAANNRARSLYHRIGFTEGMDLTSLRLT